MIKRCLKPPTKSFLLLGPRGTGKSTWLKQSVSAAHTIDLLHSDTYLKYSRNPSYLRQVVAALKSDSWIVIDEIQRIPMLLNEVHALYEKKLHHFALSGSSARKLKRSDDSNLLAGRALRVNLFPMVFSEYGSDYSLSQAIDWGTLPPVIDQFEHKEDTLATYVETYLKEELLAEAVIRKLDPFVRFLQVAGIYNGQLLNVENVARDTQIKRPTIDHYFQILIDTLIGFRLPAYRPSIKAKELGRPKFYLFDAGVARGCAGLLREPVDDHWRGFALETLILNELRAYNAYQKKERPLYHYSVSGSYDIDFIIETRRKTLSKPGELLCLEVKHSRSWKEAWNRPLKDFEKNTKATVRKKMGVYLGPDLIQKEGIDIYPVEKFLQGLWAGEIF